MAIIYRGPSGIDNKPIVAFVVPRSRNTKTGDMEQLFIVRDEISPLEAQSKGEDKSVCGDCKMRRSAGGSCYVFQGLNSSWNAYKRGKYEDVPLDENRPLRATAYGDLAALPKGIIPKVFKNRKKHTAYTHGWRTNPHLKDFAMASVDNISEKKEANDLGFRTFRVMKEYGELMLDEVLCPHYTHGVQCDTCMLCSGNKIKAKNVAVYVHGALKGRFA